MKFLICFLLNTLLIKSSFAMGGAVVNPDQNVGSNFIFQEEYSGLSESYLSPQTTITREYSAEDNSRSYSLNEYISLNNQAIQTWNHLLECNSGSIKIARENYFNSTLCQNPEDRPSALSKLLELKGSTQSYLISAPSSRYGNPLNIKKFPMHPLLSQIFVEYLVSIRHKFQEGQKAVYGKIAPTNSLELEVNMMMCLDLNIQNKTCDYLKDIINPKYARTVIEHSLTLLRSANPCLRMGLWPHAAFFTFIEHDIIFGFKISHHSPVKKGEYPLPACGKDLDDAASKRMNNIPADIFDRNIKQQYIRMLKELH